MADDQQQKRAQPITLNDRPSTADRVRQIQEMQSRMEVQSAPPAKPAAAPETARKPAAPSPAQVTTAFDVGAVRAVGNDLRGEHVQSKDPSIYAKAQVDAAKLFGPGNGVELTGNPWKVIDFSPHLPALFEPPKPLAEYEARVPDEAAQTDQGLLFQVSLQPKDAKEPVLTRAVLTSGNGQLAGAECKNSGELSGLLSRAPALAQQIFMSAFGGVPPQGSSPKILNVAPGRRAAFDVTVGQGSDVRTVPVNNFGRPVPPGVDGARANLIVANYLVDRFEPAH